MPLSIIQLDNIDVKNKANVFSLGEMNDALQGCNISGSSSPPSGESTLAFILPRDTSRGGLSEKPKLPNSDNISYVDKLSDKQVLNSASAGLDGLDSTNCDNLDLMRICEGFNDYIKDLESSQKLFAHIKNEGQGLEALCVIDRVSGSRYFPEGRAKIRRKIQKRIRKQKERGIYLVLTVDAKRYSMIEAWNMIWECFKLFRDALNKYRERHMNARGSLRYVAVLEQHKSGYPHLNVFFPGLRVLIKKSDFDKLKEWWKMGNVETQKERKPESVCNYVLKYVSKMEGWSTECFAVLWYYRVRLWNMSHCMYSEKEASGWVLIGLYKSSSFEYLVSLFGVTVVNLQDIRFILINSS